MDLLEILSYSLLDYFPCVKSLKNIHLYSNYVALIYLLWQITQIGVWRRFRKTTAGRNTGQLEAEIPNLGQQLKSKKKQAMNCQKTQWCKSRFTIFIAVTWCRHPLESLLIKSYKFSSGQVTLAQLKVHINVSWMFSICRIQSNNQQPDRTGTSILTVVKHEGRIWKIISRHESFAEI